MEQLSKILLYPLSLVYRGVTAFRNWLYTKGYLRSVRFDFPVITVGNLTVGGTGKTPHTEYLIMLLQYVYKVATLSRGYGRSTHGFLMAEATSNATQIGDEPRQFKAKFPETIVCVGEDRVLAIPRILDARPDTDVILLDDAFQHRAVKAGLSILLTDYSNLFTRDAVLPLGWLRESSKNYHRADIIVVTKCPTSLALAEREAIVSEIKPYKYQKVYFSTMQYGQLYPFYRGLEPRRIDNDTRVLLVCGIANYQPLKQYLLGQSPHVYVREFSNHHRFDNMDVDSVIQTYRNLGDVKKIMVITEKDAARLEPFGNWFLQNKIEIFVQPVRVEFLGDDAQQFNNNIIHYIEHTKNKYQNNPQ